MWIDSLKPFPHALLSDIFDARGGEIISYPHTFAARNFALRASLRCRSMRGYHRIAAPQLINCHPER